MNKIVIYARTIFFMCFSSLFLSTKYQKIDDLLICNEFSSIFCEQTNSNLLSQVNVAEESDSEWLWNCYYFSYVCVWFSIPCQQFCQDWKFFFGSNFSYLFLPCHELLLLLFPYEPSGGFQTLPNIVTNKHKTMGLKNVTQIYYPLQTNLLK